MILTLGIRLSTQGSKETRLRFMVMSGAVAVGVCMLLITIAALRIMQSNEAISDSNVLLYRLSIGIGALCLFVPTLMLLGMATRLGAIRREERFAAMRLIGTTQLQTNMLAAVDAAVSAFCGTLIAFVLLGIGCLGLRILHITGLPFAQNLLAPPIMGILLIIVGVPIAATAVALLAMRRVRISPLGVRTRTLPKQPRAFRLLPFPAGVLGLMATMAWTVNHKDPGNIWLTLLLISFVTTMAGLAIAGPWVTMIIARVVAHKANRPTTLLAARRLEANPKGAFRAMSGMILSLFGGTIMASVAPLMEKGADSTSTQILQRGIYGAIIITLIIAGSSLAVGLVDSIVERRRAFTLLRLSGVSMTTLRHTLLFESGVPLLIVAILSALSGIAIAALIGVTGFPNAALPHPEPLYYGVVGVSLVIALLFIFATMPVLERTTRLSSATFE